MPLTPEEQEEFQTYITEFEAMCPDEVPDDELTVREEIERFTFNRMYPKDRLFRMWISTCIDYFGVMRTDKGIDSLGRIRELMGMRVAAESLTPEFAEDIGIEK